MPGMFLAKGQPKSLYRPGSSTDVLVFQKEKITFCEDIVSNMYRVDAHSRFSKGFQRPLVETEVDVRSTVAHRRMKNE
jgi:phosphatidylserine decarboxylase